MALRNLTDPAEATTRLQAWLAARIAGSTDVLVSGAEVPSASGMSNETMLFDAAWTLDGARHEQRLVARILPQGEGVFADYDLAAEQLVMNALSDHTLVPVPRVLFREDDRNVLGSPFMVMERADGRAPTDDPPYTVTGWLLDMDPAARRDLNDNALRALADIHAVAWQPLGLRELDRGAVGGGMLDRYLQDLGAFREWANDDPNPVIDNGLQWLKDHQPAADGELCLVWGDARIGNMLFAEDGTVNAVLDWESAQIGSPEIDLGWWLFLLRHHTEGIGVPLPGGLLGHQATIERYQELTRHVAVDVDFYELLAGVRLSIMMARAARMMIAGGMLPPDSTMALNNPATQLVSRLLGMPKLTGDSVSFIGNR
jgi:aminoglycoside phosphotransferase (APT) family kinase protein